MPPAYAAALEGERPVVRSFRLKPVGRGGAEWTTEIVVTQRTVE